MKAPDASGQKFWAPRASGEVEITEDGTDNIVTLQAGDMAHFALGMKTHWHVKTAVRKFFVIRTPEPFEL